MDKGIKIRTVFRKSPFPDLYEKKPKTPLCASLAKGKHSSELILIHHLHEVSLPFIRALSGGYNIRRIIGIPYSSVNSIVNKLKKDFEVIIPDKLGDIPSLVKEAVESSTKKVIIEEIGGYTRDIERYLDKSKHVRGVVEDTHQGHWRWKKSKLRKLPILSVAFLRLKRFEDNFIGKSIIDGLERFLYVHNLPLIKDQKILVLGFGNIGEQVSKYLKPLCKEMFVYDTDPIKLLKARIDYKVSNKFSKADIILGLTGNPQHSVKVGDVNKLGPKPILVSGSSKRVEFDLDGFERKADKKESSDGIWTYYFNKKIVRVANLGEPINLRYSVVPSKILDLVYGSLVYCINKLDMGVVKPGLHEISESEQRGIVEKYNQLYKITKRL